MSFISNAEESVLSPRVFSEVTQGGPEKEKNREEATFFTNLFLSRGILLFTSGTKQPIGTVIVFRKGSTTKNSRFAVGQNARNDIPKKAQNDVARAIPNRTFCKLHFRRVRNSFQLKQRGMFVRYPGSTQLKLTSVCHSVNVERRS